MRYCQPAFDAPCTHHAIHLLSKEGFVNPTLDYVVVRPHTSEFPAPMILKRGDRVSVGERYDGPEGWPDWYLCSVPGQEAGFVPAQILDRHADGTATMQEDFTNRELTVVEGDELYGERRLNGWLWATRRADAATGWVPLDNVRACGLEPPSSGPTT